MPQMNVPDWGLNFAAGTRATSNPMNLGHSVAGPSKVPTYGQFAFSPSGLVSTLPGQPSPDRFVSPRGCFKVSEFLTLKGEAGWPIRASVNFTHQTSEVVFLRLVLGKKALTTSVAHVAGGEHGVWQLDAITPHSSEVQFSSFDVPLAVQALRGNGEVLDSLLIGSFTYTQGQSTGVLAGPSPLMKQHRLDTAAATRRPSDPAELIAAASPSRSQPSPPPSSSSRSRSTRSPRGAGQKKSQVLMRTRRLEPGEDLGESHRVTFELLTPLDQMCADFTDEEINIGRRLIRFSSQIDGARLRVSCERIKQEEYTEGDAVVSCIYRRDNGNCYFTSVDIICLLEGLVGEGFEIEEKNRIRRNLEGFHPETVSKNRKNSEDFFQQIMEFPSPKPRHIEKDVKVFHWSILGRALDKIISKYSLYTQSSKAASPPNPHAQRFSSPSSDGGLPPAVVPSHPRTDAYGRGLPAGSGNPFFQLESQYTADPNTMDYFFGADMQALQSDPTMGWSSSLTHPTPTLSPSPSESSSAASEMHAVSGFNEAWPEELTRPSFTPPVYHQASAVFS